MDKTWHPRKFGFYPMAALAAFALCAAQASLGQGPPAAKRPDNVSQFLQQATFGPTADDIAYVQEIGLADWIEEQRALPATLHEPFVVDFIDLTIHEPIAGLEESSEIVRRRLFELLELLHDPARRFAWWHAAMTGPDQLRQRVAFALSEIFVVSDLVPELRASPQGLASYYDVLVRNALGSYRDLLEDVTFHPAMGFYLSHLNNSKSNPAEGIFPDENYAREVMQLFSIGLDELHPDGTLRLGDDGESISTYTNFEITEFARVFTGLGPGHEGAEFGGWPRTPEPMRMYEAFHEQGEKHLLNGFVVPDGQTGLEDIADALDNLFHHPNVGPFIGKQLIQRLVKSNPSKAYVERISGVFADNGSGVRGDLGAVVEAILLDDEARHDADAATRGHLQEPWIRYVSLLRAFGASSESGYYLNLGGLAQESLLQHPLSAPSVFNFFQTGFRPNGPVAAAGLVAPEFQITNSSSVITSSNFLDGAIFEQSLSGGAAQLPIRSLVCWYYFDQCVEAATCEDDECIQDTLQGLGEGAFAEAIQPYRVTFDFEPQLALAGDSQALVTNVAELLAAGKLSQETETAIVEAVDGLASHELRVRLAIYLVLVSPGAAVAD